MISRINFLILCLVAALPAHAERYSSDEEAFVSGALQALIFMFIFWVWGLIKGNKSKSKETQHQYKENATSKIIQPPLSPWERFKADNPDIAKDIQSITMEDLQHLSENDIFEKVATFKRMSKHLDCPISELRNITVNMLVSKFNVEELREVVDRLTLKSETESREYSISEKNTMSYYTKIWLSEYLQNISIVQ